MPHPLARNRRMRRQYRLRAVAIADRTDARDVSDPVTRQVFSGKDREHAGAGKRRACIDAGDARMGVRRAQHECVRLAGPADVVDISAVTGDEAPVLDPADRLTYAELLHWTSPPSACRQG